MGKTFNLKKFRIFKHETTGKWHIFIPSAIGGNGSMFPVKSFEDAVKSFELCIRDGTWNVLFNVDN